jgi:hypothetical protein
MTQPKPELPNAKQAEEWNAATGTRWLERHERVDQQIAPFGRRAMDRADIRLGLTAALRRLSPLSVGR